MQKAFSLQMTEAQQADALQREHQRLLAQFGGLTLDMEETRKALTGINEQRRNFVNTIVARVGAKNVIGARVEGMNLICEVAGDEMPPTMQAVDGKAEHGREELTNGKA